MKKLFALLLALVMVLALAACGEDSPKTTKNNNDKDDTKNTTVPSAPTTAPTTDGEDVPPAKPDYLIPLEAYIGMKFRGEFDGLEQRMPQVTWDWYKREIQYTPQMVIDNMKMQFATKPAQLKGEYGEDCQVTYAITLADAIGSVDLYTIALQLQTLYTQMDVSKVTEGMFLKYDLTFAGSLKEHTSEGIDYAVIKYDGVWYHVVLEGLPTDSTFNAYIDF